MIEIVYPITNIFLHSLIVCLMWLTLSRCTGVQKRMARKLCHEKKCFVAVRSIANDTSQDAMLGKSTSKVIAKASHKKSSVNGFHFMLNMGKKLTEPDTKLIPWA